MSQQMNQPMNEQNPPPPQLPELRLDFYETAVLMSKWSDDGRLQTYPVDVHDVVGACAKIEMRSSLLPANALFWGQRGDKTMLGIYVPARRWQMQTDVRRYHLPMPPFVFIGVGTMYQIFAIKKRPFRQSSTQPFIKRPFQQSSTQKAINIQLYHAPSPNVYGSGGICSGNTPFPACSSETIQTALKLFMEDSTFNADLCTGKCNSHQDDIRHLWEKLDGKKRFPLGELVPMNMRLQDLM